MTGTIDDTVTVTTIQAANADANHDRIRRLAKRNQTPQKTCHHDSTSKVDAYPSAAETHSPTRSKIYFIRTFSRAWPRIWLVSGAASIRENGSFWSYIFSFLCDVN
jgi:hypothetical protein